MHATAGECRTAATQDKIRTTRLTIWVWAFIEVVFGTGNDHGGHRIPPKFTASIHGKYSRHVFTAEVSKTPWKILHLPAVACETSTSREPIRIKFISPYGHPATLCPLFTSGGNSRDSRNPSRPVSAFSASRNAPGVAFRRLWVHSLASLNSPLASLNSPLSSLYSPTGDFDFSPATSSTYCGTPYPGSRLLISATIANPRSRSTSKWAVPATRSS